MRDPARPPAVLFLTPSAEPLARRIAGHFGWSLHGRGAMGPVDAKIEGVAAHIRALFLGGRPVIGVMAAGIAVRALGPVLGDKRAEPPVLAVAEDGSAVVPLLGGHRGANRLAGEIAMLLGVQAAVTTAGELSLGVALDAPPEGWRLEDPGEAKAAMAALLSGAAAWLSARGAWLAPLAPRPGIVAGPPPDAGAPDVLAIEGGPTLVYRRQDLALGVGCARGCPPDELIGLVEATLADAGLSRFAVAGVWSAAIKTDEAAVHALAAHLGVPARFFEAPVLEAETPRLATPSAAVFAEVGCHGVAEAAALVAAGPSAGLLVPKRKTGAATCALSRIEGAGSPGSARGHLAVVGIGPGAPDWRTPEAARLIAEADELVGYGLYLDLLGPLAEGKRRTDFPLGGEEARCRHALEAAGAGGRVALVCSGDAGIYAMGALVMELLDRAPDDGGVSAAARRAAIAMVPGISALQAASARAGALLGHDFCAISLSDLLTPRPDILRRVGAAAEGDFVVAFYNPVSRRRRDLLDAAREILARHRPPDTPVLLARNLGRPGERLAVRTLATLESDEVDMLTVVLVGSTGSRVFRTGDAAAGAGGQWLYTPRGYAARIDAPAGSDAGPRSCAAGAS